MNANTDDFETLRQRYSVLACQKISLERQVAELKAENLILKNQIEQAQQHLVRAGFRFADEQARLEREYLSQVAVIREANTLILEHDPHQVIACEREPAGPYETLAADLYQLLSTALETLEAPAPETEPIDNERYYD